MDIGVFRTRADDVRIAKAVLHILLMSDNRGVFEANDFAPPISCEYHPMAERRGLHKDSAFGHLTHSEGILMIHESLPAMARRLSLDRK